jgi:L-iditol 2-dehydrogenase
LCLEDIHDPQIKSGNALLKVCCAGICSSDISRVYDSNAYYYPIILGHEFSGVVENVYNDCDKHWIGKNVGVYPLIPCFKCKPCINGHYETCLNYSYIGSRQNGAFAEYVAVPVWNLVEIPKAINMESAALIEPAAVALHAVKNADLKCVSSVNVFGRGVIGRLVSLWLNIFGIKDISLIGRDNVFPRNIDLCFEVVGKTSVLRNCIESVCPNGQIILVGNPDKNFYIEQSLYWQILRKQLSIKGIWNSLYDEDWQETILRIQNCELQFDGLITHKYPFKELDKALEMMHNNNDIRCKVIIDYT